MDLYEKLKIRPEPQKDAFREDLSARSISSKLALVCLLSGAASLLLAEMNAFTMFSFSGFLLLSLLYGFLRIRES